MNDCQKRGGGSYCDRFRWNKLIKGVVLKALLVNINYGHQILRSLNIIFLEHYHATTGRERLIRSHSSARFCFELSGNSN